MNIRATLPWWFVMLLASGPTLGGTWLVGSGSAPRGEAFELDISFAGDGEVVAADAEIFFEGALFVLERATPSNTAACLASGWGRIVVSATLVASNEVSRVCRLRFRVLDQPYLRGALINGRSTGCYVHSGDARECTVRYGETSALSDVPYRTRAHEIIVVVAQRPGAPDISVLWGLDYATAGPALLRAFDAARPDHVFPLMWPRPHGEYAEALRDAPDTGLARRYRSIVVRYSSWSEAACGVAALRADPDVESVEIPDPGMLEGVRCALTPRGAAAVPVPTLDLRLAMLLASAVLLTGARQLRRFLPT